MVHAERLQAAVGDGVGRRHGHDRRPQPQRLLEGQSELAVGGVHQHVRTGLDLVRPDVDVVRAGATRGDDVAADVAMGGEEQGHRLLAQLAAHGAIVHADGVSLVAHHPAHGEAVASRQIGEAAGVAGLAAAARQADVDVDDDLAHGAAGGGRRGDGGVGVDRDGDARLHAGQALGLQGLVGEQEVVPEAGRRHADHLPHRRAAEGAMADGRLAAGQLGALVRLDVRAQARPRQGRGHGAQVVLEGGGVDQQGRRDEVVDRWHDGPRIGFSGWAPPAA